MAKITEKLTKKVIVEIANTIALDEAALTIFENAVKEKHTLVKLREALADPKRYRLVNMYGIANEALLDMVNENKIDEARI